MISIWCGLSETAEKSCPKNSKCYETKQVLYDSGCDSGLIECKNQNAPLNADIDKKDRNKPKQKRSINNGYSSGSKADQELKRETGNR